MELIWRGRLHHLGTTKEQCILAILFLECGHQVTAEALVDRVWGHNPPGRVRTTLTSYISRARGRLRQATGGALDIDFQNGAYCVVADPELIDLHRFRRLRRQALSIAESGDDERALALFEEAEECCKGEPLAGLPGQWMQGMRTSLLEEQRAARLERVGIELRNGRHAAVVSELRRLLTQHPEDEHLAHQLMIALYRCDRQIDALAVYQETRAFLRENYGSEPGERLRETHRRILRQDLELAVTPRYRTGDRADQPHTLLPDPEGFTGRETEIRSLTENPEAGSLAVIRGMPGIGKTALALRAAHRLRRQYPDAQLYLNLCGHEPERDELTAASALSQLLGMLAIPPTRIPSDPRAREELWQREIAHRRMVILLDDVTDPDQVAPILPRTPGSRVLITTRRRLGGIPQARYLSLDVLSRDEAVELFVKVAGRYEIEGGPRTEEIVERLGNLPMAIRLAAAGLRDRQMDDTRPSAEYLIPEGPPLEDTWEVDPAIVGAFELSYRHLSEAQQFLFRHLAFSPCPRLTLPAAAALAERPSSVVRGELETLVEHHLLSGDERNGYFFHHLTRLFARARSKREDNPRDRRRHLNRMANFYLEATDRADRALYPYRRRSTADSGPAATEPEEFLDAEWRNILAVALHSIAHERKKQGADLIIMVSKFLETSGFWEECTAANESALQSYRGLGDRQGMGKALLELTSVRFRTGDHERALQNVHESLALHRALGESAAEAQSLDWTGVILLSTGHVREALAHFQEAQNVYQGIGDLHGEAEALGHSGVAYWHLGRYGEAASSFQKSLVGFQEVGDRRIEAMVLNNFGEVHRQRGRHRDAVALYERSLEIFEEISGRQYLAIIQNNLGAIQHYKGNYSEALRRYRDAIFAFRDTGDRKNIASVLNSIGAAYQQLERYSEALIHHGEAKELAEAINEPYELTRALVGIADLESALGNHGSALERYRAALSLAQSMGDPYQEGRIHDGMGSVVLHTIGPEAARIHWRQALDLFQGLEVPEAETVSIRLRIIDDLSRGPRSLPPDSGAESA